jgi:hypothetical protein
MSLPYEDFCFLDFSDEEFAGKYSLAKLSGTLRDNGFIVNEDTVLGLNNLLRQPDLLNIATDDGKKALSENLTRLNSLGKLISVKFSNICDCVVYE